MTTKGSHRGQQVLFTSGSVSGLGSSETARFTPRRSAPPSWQPDVLERAQGDSSVVPVDTSDSLEVAFAPSAGQAHAKLGVDRDDVVKNIQTVSLGSYCGVKASLLRLGLGEAHMPFDWMRTSSQGLVYWLQNHFDGFFKMNQLLNVTLEGTDREMRVFRSRWHSFWHDDIDEQTARDKLKRRIDRFCNLDQDADLRDLLFVRSVAGTPELADVEIMFGLLRANFETHGRRVFLCVIVDDQPITGPVLHSKHDQIIFWVQPIFDGALHMDVTAPFEDAIAYAVRRVLSLSGGPKVDDCLPAVSNAMDLVSPTGPLGMAGMRESIAGVWSGRAKVQGYDGTVDVAAFEGYDQLSVSAVSSDKEAPEERVVTTLANERHDSPQKLTVNHNLKQAERTELEQGVPMRRMRELLAIQEDAAATPPTFRRANSEGRTPNSPRSPAVSRRPGRGPQSIPSRSRAVPKHNSRCQRT